MDQQYPHIVQVQPRRENHTRISIPGDMTGMAMAPILDSCLLPFQNLSQLSIRKTSNADGYRFDIVNMMGQSIYYGQEEVDCFRDWCQGISRPFIIKIFDMTGHPVLTIERENDCCLCFCGAHRAAGEVVVKLADSGEKIGTVAMDVGCHTPKFHAHAGNGIMATNEIMIINGPTCGSRYPVFVFGCEGDAQFHIKMTQTLSGERRSVGIIHQDIGNSGNPGIEFFGPYNSIPPQMKALLLGALFCIDTSFFDRSGCCNFKVGCTGFDILYLILVMVIVAIRFYSM